MFAILFVGEKAHCNSSWNGLGLELKGPGLTMEAGFFKRPALGYFYKSFLINFYESSNRPICYDINTQPVK